MNHTFTQEQGRASDEVVPVADPCSAPRSPLLERARAVRQAWLQVFGIPDYERYVAHLALRHPGEAMLSRREFYLKAIDRKYGRNGPRCC